ncbi:TRAP transporter substrate-binding protein [Azohydromonas lata]|uniref:TRAP transporter substrate-binding protein n=1 Tax=Azohydromonas lata TaxID=45677 RepID=A0ABU5IGR1_9BURK|nr:TRAP transporter substrate-binding protein [Azohydromonas lata]MDZ5458321.1 TRAP transporter substrate-binding protein [Azohydromonas lata]
MTPSGITRRTALATTALLLGGAAQAQVEDRTIRIGTTVPADHPISLGAKKFTEIVAAKSAGKLKVKDYPALALGPELQQQSALIGGVQEMFVPSSATLAGIVREFTLLDLPYLIRNPAQADALMDGPFGQALLAKLPEKGLVGLAMWENGLRHITNSRHPIQKLEDVQGLKIRVQQNPIFIDMFKALKANPVPMSFGEVYGALETKALDAQENPLLVARSAKLYEVQKYASLTGHAYGVIIVLVSKKLWDKLSADERKLLQASALEARDYQRQVSREQARKAMEELKAAGMVINEVAPAELDRMRQAVQPVADRALQTFDPALVRLLRSELERVSHIG